MRAETREKRQAEIAAAAWRVIEDTGPSGLSMQAVAREAKASMETLYRWYGDKTGLYAALVADNALRIEQALVHAKQGADNPALTLQDIGAQLYDMLTSERVVALNRAAAGDTTGNLGAALALGGRERIVPHLLDIVAQVVPAAPLPEATGLFVDLLLGDVQIRRATASLAVPPAGTGQTRAISAVANLRKLYPTA